MGCSVVYNLIKVWVFAHTFYFYKGVKNNELY